MPSTIRGEWNSAFYFNISVTFSNLCLEYKNVSPRSGWCVNPVLWMQVLSHRPSFGFIIFVWYLINYTYNLCHICPCPWIRESALAWLLRNTLYHMSTHCNHNHVGELMNFKSECLYVSVCCHHRVLCDVTRYWWTSH